MSLATYTTRYITLAPINIPMSIAGVRVYSVHAHTARV